MSGGEAALRRDRFIILAALLLLIAAAWAYLFRLAADMTMPPQAMPMSGMDMSMPGMDMGMSMAPAMQRCAVAAA